MSMNPIAPLFVVGGAALLALKDKKEHAAKPVQPEGKGGLRPEDSLAINAEVVKQLGAQLNVSLEGAHLKIEGPTLRQHMKAGEVVSKGIQGGNYAEAGAMIGNIIGSTMAVAFAAAPTVGAALPIFFSAVVGSVGGFLTFVTIMGGAISACGVYVALVLLAALVVVGAAAMIEIGVRQGQANHQRKAVALMMFNKQYKEAQNRVIAWNSIAENYKIALPQLDNFKAGFTPEQAQAMTIQQFATAFRFGQEWAQGQGIAEDYRNLLGAERISETNNPDDDPAFFRMPSGVPNAGQSFDFLATLRAVDNFFYEGWNNYCEHLKRKPTWQEWHSYLSKHNIGAYTIADILDLRLKFVRGWAACCGWLPGSQSTTANPAYYDNACAYYHEYGSKALGKRFGTCGVPPNRYGPTFPTVLDVPGEFLGVNAVKRSKWGPYLHAP